MPSWITTSANHAGANLGGAVDTGQLALMAFKQFKCLFGHVISPKPSYNQRDAEILQPVIATPRSCQESRAGPVIESARYDPARLDLMAFLSAPP